MSRYVTLKTVTKSVTFLWMLPRSSVTWVKEPEKVPRWDLSPSYFWSGYIATPSVHESRRDEIQAPPPTIRNYPRLVRVPEAQPKHLFPFNVEPPEHPYEILSGLLPDFYEDAFKDSMEERRELPLPIAVKLNKIKKVAESHGLLVHPTYGDSVYGWVAAAFLFQTLMTLWRVLELDGAEHYWLTVEQLRHRWLHVPELWIGKKLVNGYDLPRPPVFKLFTDTHLPKRVKSPPPRNALRREILFWLNNEFNRSIEGPARSNIAFYADQTQGMNLLLKHEGKEVLPKGESMPYVSLKAGLYAYALFTFLVDFRAGGELNTCAGCGRMFFPTRTNAKHCNVSRESCRKRAERNRKKAIESA